MKNKTKIVKKSLSQVILTLPEEVVEAWAAITENDLTNAKELFIDFIKQTLEEMIGQTDMLLKQCLNQEHSQIIEFKRQNLASILSKID